MRKSEEAAAFHGAGRPGEDLSKEESPSKKRGMDEFNVDEITVTPHGDSNVWDKIGKLDFNAWG